jgi:protein-S-isoprenylcysteine O-methyltransferase
MGSRLSDYILCSALIFIAPPLLAGSHHLLHPAPWAGCILGVITLVTQPPLSPRALVVDPTDRRSALVILLGVAASFLAASVEFSVRSPLFPSATSWCVWGGLTITAVGLTIRLWAIRELGELFTSSVAVQEGQPVVTTGPYKWVRHPSYTGSLLTTIGIGFALGSVAGMALSILVTLPAYLFRIRIEERALLARLDEPYARYQQQTWRLVPLVL